MKLLLLVLVVTVAVLGGLLGTFLVRDPGYVLITYDTWVLETSIWVGLVLLFLLLGGLFLIGFTIRRIVASQIRLSGWATSRKLRNARNQTVRGLLVMAEGRWADAQKLLLGAAPQVETPLINYLNAARAAHELGQRELRDEHLKAAQASTPGAKFAVTLTQAELQIEDGHYEQALAALLQLRKRAPKQGAVLSLLADCYEGLQDWASLQPLLAELKKHSGMSAEQLSALEKQVWSASLLAAPDAQAAWKKLPKGLRRDADLLRAWVAQIDAVEQADEAEFAMRTLLDVQWIPEVVAQYGLVRSADVAKQLAAAKNWAKSHPSDAHLLLTLGRLSLMNKNFDQAREHFEASVRVAPSQAAYGELGRLCIAQGDERRGTDYLVKSLEGLADLPLPQSPTLRQTGVA